MTADHTTPPEPASLEGSGHVEPPTRAPARWGPGLVVAVLYLAGVFLVLTGPAWAGTGIYQVVIEHPQARAEIPSESLDCAWTEPVARCTADVDGRPLTVTATYRVFTSEYYTGWDFSSDCALTYGTVQVPCASRYEGYGHSLHSVYVDAAGLGLTAEQVAAADTWLPWRGDFEPLIPLVLFIGLPAGAAVLTVAGRRDAPALPRRGRSVAAVALAAAALPPLLALLTLEATRPDPGAMLLFSLPLWGVGVVLLGAWQHVVGGPQHRAGAFGRSVGAFAATGAYTVGVLFMALLAAGYID